MNQAKYYSEELSEDEKAMLAAFVVPAPSASMEDDLLCRLPGQQGLRRRPSHRGVRRAVVAAAVLAAAAAILWALDVERFSNRETSSDGSVERRRRVAIVSPNASRPKASWALTGSAQDSYETGLDSASSRNGKAMVFLRALEANTGFGSLTREISAREYQGRRLRLSALVRTDSVAPWAGLWMRVDDKDEHIAFDNMKSRPIVGTTDWTRHAVVLDVPENATEISYGVLLSGLGTVWIDELGLDVVSGAVATTELLDADGWFEGDSSMDLYETGLDHDVMRGGKPVRSLESKDSAVGQQGTWQTRVDGRIYRKRRVRFSAFVRTVSVNSWAGLWLRADVKDATNARVASSELQNMVKHPIRGTTGWTRYEVILDVASTATQLVYGVMLDGDGKVWIDEPALEVLDE